MLFITEDAFIHKKKLACKIRNELLFNLIHLFYGKKLERPTPFVDFFGPDKNSCHRQNIYYCDEKHKSFPTLASNCVLFGTNLFLSGLVGNVSSHVFIWLDHILIISNKSKFLQSKVHSQNFNFPLDL